MDKTPPTPATKEEAKGKGRPQSVQILILSVLIMILAAVFITQDMNKIKAFIIQVGVWGVFVSIALYALLGLTFIPSEPLTLFIGALFGPWMATLIAGTGNTFAAMVEYYLGTHIGSATNFQEKKDKLPFGLGSMKVESPVFLIGARMIPWFGPKVVSMMAGVYRVPILRYIWTTMIPIFCGAVIFAYGGVGIGILTKIK